MTDKHILDAEIREDVGKGASRRLRHQGKIPAVLYGGHKDPVTLSLELAPLMHAAGRESFYSSILEIRVADGRSQNVVVRDVHHHPFKPQIMHLDFMRVSAEEILRMSVPIHFTGEDRSPAGKSSGVVIQHLMTEVEISALPANLPEFLAVDLSALEDGGVVMLSDIELPEGVQVPALAHGSGGDFMVANTVRIRETQGTGVAAELEAAEERFGEPVETPTISEEEAGEDSDADMEE